MVQIELGSDLDKQLEKIQQIIKGLEEAEEKAEGVQKKFQTLTIKEFAEATHMGISEAQKTFNLPDFPSCNYGKSKFAEINAVKEYFKIPRRK